MHVAIGSGCWIIGAQAIALTGGLASQHQSRVTVLLVDDQPVEQDPSIARMDFLSTCAPSDEPL